MTEVKQELGEQKHDVIVAWAPVSAKKLAMSAEEDTKEYPARYYTTINLGEENQGNSIDETARLKHELLGSEFPRGDFVFYGVSPNQFDHGDQKAVEAEFNRQLDEFIASNSFNHIPPLSPEEKSSEKYKEAEAWIIRSAKSSQGTVQLSRYQQQIIGQDWVNSNRKQENDQKILLFYDVEKGFCAVRRTSFSFLPQQSLGDERVDTGRINCRFHMFEQQIPHKATFFVEASGARGEEIIERLQAKVAKEREWKESKDFSADSCKFFTPLRSLLHKGQNEKIDYIDIAIKLGIPYIPYWDLTDTERRDLNLFVAYALPKNQGDALLNSRIKDHLGPADITYQSLLQFYTEKYSTLSIERKRDINLLVALTEPKYPELYEVAAKQRFSWLGRIWAKWLSIDMWKRLVAISLIVAGSVLMALFPILSIPFIVGAAGAFAVTLIHVVHTLVKEPTYYNGDDKEVFYEPNVVHSTTYNFLTTFGVLLGLAAIGLGIAGVFGGLPTMFNALSIVGALSSAQAFAVFGAVGIVGIVLLHNLYPLLFGPSNKVQDEGIAAASMAKEISGISERKLERCLGSGLGLKLKQSDYEIACELLKKVKEADSHGKKQLQPPAGGCTSANLAWAEGEISRLTPKQIIRVAYFNKRDNDVDYNFQMILKKFRVNENDTSTESYNDKGEIYFETIRPTLKRFQIEEYLKIWLDVVAEDGERAHENLGINNSLPSNSLSAFRSLPHP